MIFNFRLLPPVDSSQVFQSNTAPQALTYPKLKGKILTLVAAVRLHENQQPRDPLFHGGKSGAAPPKPGLALGGI